MQTKHNNSQHFIIEGERGIGKSSLMFCGQSVANGSVPLLETTTRVKFLVANISMEAKDDSIAICKKLVEALRGASLKYDPLKKIALKLWEFVTSFEAAGVRFKKPSSPDIQDFSSALADDLETILIRAGESLDGILILIDEADNASEENGLGILCKLVTEKLSYKGINRVCLGLAGLPAVVSGLRHSHESSPRLFEILSLKPLEMHERGQVIRQALQEANSRGRPGPPTTISDNAMDMLCRLSEGYPHFLQEFCYHAFETDVDNKIDEDDVLSCLFNKHGVFDQLGRKYFSPYYDALLSDEYKKVLHAMARHFDEPVDRQTIVRESGLKASSVDNALRALKAKQVILQDEHKKRSGVYRLPTRSFAIWIKLKDTAPPAGPAKTVNNS
jgi:hypothetical protein